MKTEGPAEMRRLADNHWPAINLPHFISVAIRYLFMYVGRHAGLSIHQQLIAGRKSRKIQSILWPGVCTLTAELSSAKQLNAIANFTAICYHNFTTDWAD